MKVTFVMPCVGREPGQAYPQSWLMEPLAIAQLAALTPAAWSVAFHDDRLEAIPYAAGTDLVAINVETYTARRAYQIAAAYRRLGVPVVLGGFHATLLPDEAARHADAVLVGEAEGLWPAVLADAAAGRLQPRYAAAQRPALGGVFPRRDVYAGKPYLGLSLVETARGCPHACEFCSISAYFQRTFRARPVAEVVEEIRRERMRRVFFVDDNIVVDAARARALLEALIPLRIRWAGQVSLQAAQDRELLRLMQRSGCMGVLVGFESLDAGSLGAMGKRVNLQAGDYAAAIARFREHGLALYATFVFGYDADTRETFRRTLDFALRHRFFFAAFNHLVPFPGTPLFARLQAEGRLLHEAWWLDPAYRFGDVAFQPQQMTPAALRALCLEYRHRFYRLSSVAWRGLDVQANCRSPFMALVYWTQNLVSRREVDQRQGLPLGMEG